MDSPLFKTAESIINLSASVITITGTILGACFFFAKNEKAQSLFVDVLRLLVWLAIHIFPAAMGILITMQHRTSVFPPICFAISAAAFSFDYVFDPSDFALTMPRLHRFCGIAAMWMILVSAVSVSTGILFATQKAFDDQDQYVETVKKSVTELSHKVIYANPMDAPLPLQEKK